MEREGVLTNFPLSYCQKINGPEEIELEGEGAEERETAEMRILHHFEYSHRVQVLVPVLAEG